VQASSYSKLSGHGPAATATQEAAAVSATASTPDVDLATDPTAAKATLVAAAPKLKAMQQQLQQQPEQQLQQQQQEQQP
jgi:hypothetical protein